MKFVVLYFVVVNVLGAAVTVWDKSAAQRGAWRVPEKTLFAWCIAGGCPGVYAAMRLVRHKTRHPQFMMGIPAIFAIQCAIAAGLWYYGII